MRKVQITMNVLMVDDAASNGTSEQIQIYADANNVYEAAASAFQELMTALEETRKVPAFGQKTHCLQHALAPEIGNAQEGKSVGDSKVFGGFWRKQETPGWQMNVTVEYEE